MAERVPPHLKLINSRLNWDWRKENPSELVVLVFILALFFTIPRAGCGITPEGAQAIEGAVVEQPKGIDARVGSPADPAMGGTEKPE